MRIELDGRVFEFGIEHGIIVEELDLGFPEVRERAEHRTDADGTVDVTAFHGGAAVTIGGTVLPEGSHTVWSVVDRLRAFCRPSARPWLYFDVDGVERRFRLRADQQSAPLTHPSMRRFQATWVAPDGIMEAAELSSVQIPASVEDEAGRAYDLVFDRVYPSSPSTGQTAVTNGGSTDVWPTVRVYGPCVDPRIISDTQGAEVAFVGLNVPAGQYLEVDMGARTARIDGLAGASRLGSLDFATSAWWPLAPGDNLVRFSPGSFSSPSTAEVRWRHAWL